MGAVTEPARSIYTAPAGPARWLPWPLPALRRRWHGHTPLARLLWRDMLLLGSMVNLGATGFALLLATRDVPGHWPVLLHFSPLPLNLFLLAALARHPQRNRWALGTGLVWAVLMTVV